MVLAHQYRSPSSDTVIKQRARLLDAAFEDYVNGLGRETEDWSILVEAWIELRKALGTYNGLERDASRA